MSDNSGRLAEFVKGVRDEAPILIGVAPFGMIYGGLAVNAGLSPVAAQAMSLILFAGAAQFILAKLFSGAASAAVMILTAFVVNLRHALYSASVAPYTTNLGFPWKVILSYLLTDEAYAVTISHYKAHGMSAFRHWYFFGAGLTLWSIWQLSSAAGIFLGRQIPASWGLEFTLPLTFIAIVVPLVKDRAMFFCAVAAGIAALFGFLLPMKLGLLAAALVGISVGIWSDR